MFILMCFIPRSDVNIKVVIHASGPDRINVLPKKIGTQSLQQFMEDTAYVVVVVVVAPTRYAFHLSFVSLASQINQS